MKRINKRKALSLVCFGLTLALQGSSAVQPKAEILDYGIYSGGHDESVRNPDAPTETVLPRGPAKLVKQTDQIPAKLKSKFGFRWVLHGKVTEPPVSLRLVFLFPPMDDPYAGKKVEKWEAAVMAPTEDRNLHMLWDFTEAYELVPGPWTFQVFRGSEKILEKRFDVVKADSK